jgi:U3 small nucleolar RNA-associated protein 12
MAILPGNKYMVLGTKEGQLLLWQLNTNTIVQRIQAHQKEIWEISYHTNPDSKALRGSMLIGTALADRTIKFYTLSQSTETGDVEL